MAVTEKFQAKWNQPVELTVLRRLEEPGAKTDTDKTSSGTTDEDPALRSEVKVTVPPVPVKTLGLGFAFGRITAIRKGSLAETAGIKVGDVIEKVDGAPIEDALRLPMLVAEKLGKPLELTVRRPDKMPASDETKSNSADKKSDSKTSPGTELSFTLQSSEPAAFGNIGLINSQLSLENYGIAYSVSPVVSWIDPASSKASSQVAVGDELTEIQVEVTAAERKEFEKNGLTLETKADAITEQSPMPLHLMRFQTLPADMKIRCKFKRGGNTREVILPLYYADNWYWIQRMVPMSPVQKIQRTTRIDQALGWGLTETQRKLNDVLEFLTIMVTGKASPKNLAGPLGIAKIASHEASDSPSRLLLFLTLLSANLAVLNFLPIPALDGGHLMFLTWEAIRGKPVNETIQVRLTMLGVMCLLGLMAFAIVNDFLREMKP